MSRNWRSPFVLVVAFSLVATACNLPGQGGGGDSSNTLSASTATVDPTAGSTAVSSASDICDGFDAFSLLEARGEIQPSLIEELGIPAEMMADHTYFQMTPLGQAGALAAAREMASGVTFCDFVISPMMAEAIQAAVSSTDSIGAIKDLMAQIKSGSGEFGLGLMGGGENAAAPDPLMGVRVFVNLSAHARSAGDLDGAALAWELAQDELTDYAEEVFNSSDAADLLISTSAQAMLLELEVLGEDLYDKAKGIVQKDLDEAAAAFSECSNDKATVQEFFRSLRASTLVNGGNQYGDTVTDWLRVQERRALGEAITECEGGDFTAATPLPAGWNGTITAHLTSCDSIEWAGDLLAVGSLDSGGAQMTMNGAVPLSLTTDDGKSAGIAHGDLVAVIDTHLSAGDATGTGQAVLDATVEFVVTKEEGRNGTATLKVDFQPGTFTLTIEAGGQTFTQNQAASWGTSEFEGPVTNGGQACD